MESGRLLLVLNHSEGLRLTRTVHCNTSRLKDIVHENGSSAKVWCSNGAAGQPRTNLVCQQCFSWHEVGECISRDHHKQLWASPARHECSLRPEMP